MKIQINFLFIILLLGCQSEKKEVPTEITKIDSLISTVPKFSMDDVLNDSIPIWKLSHKEQWERSKKMERFRYYGNIKLTKRDPLYYGFQGRNGDTIITESFPGILNHQYRVSNYYVHKLEYYNENKEKIKEVFPKDFNPYSEGKYKNISYGFPYYEFIEGFDYRLPLNKSPNFYILNIEAGTQPNGYSIIAYHLYSFFKPENGDSPKFLGEETSLIGLNQKGKKIVRTTKEGNIWSASINDTGQFLSLITKKDSLPDEFQILDLQTNEIIYNEKTKNGYEFYSFYNTKNGLLKLTNRRKYSKKSIGNYHCFFDLEKQIKIEKEFSDKELGEAFANFSSYWDLIQKNQFDTIPY